MYVNDILIFFDNIKIFHKIRNVPKKKKKKKKKNNKFHFYNN